MALNGARGKIANFPEQMREGTLDQVLRGGVVGEGTGSRETTEGGG
jgi:hypothetical protein